MVLQAWCLDQWGCLSQAYASGQYRGQRTFLRFSDLKEFAEDAKAAARQKCQGLKKNVEEATSDDCRRGLELYPIGLSRPRGLGYYPRYGCSPRTYERFITPHGNQKLDKTHLGAIQLFQHKYLEHLSIMQRKLPMGDKIRLITNFNVCYAGVTGSGQSGF